MCCHQTYQLGKLTEDNDIMDIWNCDLAREIRAVTDRGELHRVCTSWRTCPYIVKERSFSHMEAHRNLAYPLYLEICLPDKHCNVGGEKPSEENPACIMCRRNFESPSQQDITEFLCRKTKKLMPYLKYLCVLGIAEPFWKDAMFKVLDQLEFDRYKQKIRFVTNTNAICLGQRISRRFFHTVKFSSVSFSLDAASPEVYKKIRRLDKFDLVIDNIKDWIKIRGGYGGSSNHEVIVYNNINMLNVHEMTAMVQMAHSLGVDSMIMLPTHDQSGVVKLGELLLCERNAHIFREAAEQAMECANELGVRLQYPARFDLPPPSLVQLTKRDGV